MFTSNCSVFMDSWILGMVTSKVPFLLRCKYRKLHILCVIEFCTVGGEDPSFTFTVGGETPFPSLRSQQVAHSLHLCLRRTEKFKHIVKNDYVHFLEQVRHRTHICTQDMYPLPKAVLLDHLALQLTEIRVFLHTNKPSCLGVDITLRTQDVPYHSMLLYN